MPDRPTRLVPIVAGAAAIAAVALAGCTSSKDATGTPVRASSSASGASSQASTPATSGSAGSSAPGSSTAPSSSAPPSSSKAPGPAGGPVPAKFVPISVSFVDADTGWVLGDAPCAKPPCTSVVRTRDGGRSWQGIPAPRAPLANPATERTRVGSVRTMRFADASNGWIAGGGLFATHDGGSTWRRVSYGSNANISSLGTAAGRVYALTDGCVGDDACSGPIEVYTSLVSSDRWSKAFSVGRSTGVRTDLVVEKSGWYLATGSGIYHGSATAVPVKLSNPCPASSGAGDDDQPPPTVAVADAQHLDAMCISGGAAGSARYQLYGTSDGGRHWKKAGPSHLEPSALAGLADNAHGVLLAAVASGASSILRSTDDGGHLSTALTAKNGGIGWLDLGFTTPSQAVAIQPNRTLYLSRDGGSSWSVVGF